MEEEIMTNQDTLEIEMEAENGEKVNVRIVNLFEDGGKSYVVADNIDGDDESYIFQIILHDDGDELVSIESEEEFNRLCDVLAKLEEQEEEEEK